MSISRRSAIIEFDGEEVARVLYGGTMLETGAELVKLLYVHGLTPVRQVLGLADRWRAITTDYAGCEGLYGDTWTPNIPGFGLTYADLDLLLATEDDDEDKAEEAEEKLEELFEYDFDSDFESMSPGYYRYNIKTDKYASDPKYALHRMEIYAYDAMEDCEEHWVGAIELSDRPLEDLVRIQSVWKCIQSETVFNRETTVEKQQRKLDKQLKAKYKMVKRTGSTIPNKLYGSMVLLEGLSKGVPFDSACLEAWLKGVPAEDLAASGMAECIDAAA